MSSGEAQKFSNSHQDGLPSSLSQAQLYEFEEYRLDVQKKRLRRQGRPVPLTAKGMEILLLLVAHAGEVVSKNELMDAVWPDCYVDEANLTQNIFLLRKAFRETAKDRNYILTEPGKGYRFAADVRRVANANVTVESGERLNSGTVALSAIAESEPMPVTPPKEKWRRVALAGIILIAAAVYPAWRLLRSQTQPDARRAVIAVLPFENLTGDANQEYFIDGLTAEMIVQLGRLDPQHLGVIARTSVMQYKKGREQLEHIARELGVDYVLEGSVRRNADRVRITAELIQVHDQTHLWAREYDRQLSDPLVLQGDVAGKLAAEVETSLGKQQQIDPTYRPPSDAAYQAHELYLKGRYFWNKRTYPGFEHAAEYFQQAIAKEPSNAPAYAGLADTYTLMSSYHFVAPSEFVPKARAAAQKALEIDANSAEAHTSLALIEEMYDWNWQTAGTEFQKAVELDPDYPTAHQWYAEYLGFQGRFDEALAESARARQLDPLSLIVSTDDSAILYFAGKYDRAIEQLQTVLEMEPGFPRAHYLLVSAYVQKGDFVHALDCLTQWRGYEDMPWIWGMQAYVYGRMGKQQESQEALAQLQRSKPNTPWDQVPTLPVVFSGMNRKDEAIAWLEKGYAEHSGSLAALKVDHVYDPLRNDPRFTSLERRIGLLQ